MEDKAKTLGLAGDIFYMFPTNEGLNSADAQHAMNLGLPVNNFMPDIYIGAGGAIPVAQSDFNRLPNFAQSAINCVTNAGTHTQDRALREAADLNDWFNVPPYLANRFPKHGPQALSFNTKDFGSGWKGSCCLFCKSKSSWITYAAEERWVWHLCPLVGLELVIGPY